MSKLDLLPEKLKEGLTQDQLQILEGISFGSNHIQTQKILDVAMQFYSANSLDRTSEASNRLAKALNLITIFGSLIAGSGVLLQYIQFFEKS
jgi:hypothetical protein